MEPIVRKLTKARFDALLYRKLPWVNTFFEELEWWSNDIETLIGSVGEDQIDHDFSWVILGRDETGVFRCIETGVSLQTLSSAREQQASKLLELSATGVSEFPQHDNKAKKLEILAPRADVKSPHPNFKLLVSDPAHAAAREIVKELSFAFTDLDGNFKKDFQSTGFHGRLWELFLYACFYELGFQIDNNHNVPDFIVENAVARLAIEATTVNPTHGAPPPSCPRTRSEEFELCRDYMPIKWGSPLHTKLKKRDWEQEHTAGLPLLFAIHDFHAPQSMTWSLPALSEYLYGLRDNGSGDYEKIENHKYEGKLIPSGFFRLPDSENVSAVIASNEATLGKFNRMGQIAGFGDGLFSMTRMGAEIDLQDMTVSGFSTKIEVGVQSETWASGLWIFHNPNAKHPLSSEVFPTSLNVRLVNGSKHCSSSKRMHILRSRTCLTPNSETQQNGAISHNAH